MAESVYTTFFSNPLEALRVIFFSPNPALLEVGAAISADRAKGYNPITGTFIAPQYAATFGGLSGIDPTDTASVRDYFRQNEAAAAQFFEMNYDRNLQDHPSLPSWFPSGSSGWIVGLFLLVVVYLFIKAVK